jgi:hypothetical protein
MLNKLSVTPVGARSTATPAKSATVTRPTECATDALARLVGGECVPRIGVDMMLAMSYII